MTEETKAADGAPAGVSDSTQLLDCVCGEKEYIYIKKVYQSYGDGVWVIECQRCYSLVPVALYKYDVDKLNAAWNAVLSGAATEVKPRRGQ